MEILVMKSGM